MRKRENGRIMRETKETGQRAMLEEIRAYMEQFHMFPESGYIVAGVSGGADSLCLLHALAGLREACGFLLAAVHVNHGLRAEAAQDAAYVRALCEAWDVPFFLIEEDVAALASREHLSCEEAGRKVRYRAFLQVLRQLQGSESGGCIAVAHNREDRAETLLFHLFRGTGLRGMGSIRPVREEKNGARIIRPLLFCGRERIEAWLEKEGISWCTDSTNLEEQFTRNKIRNRVLPYVRKEICAGAGQNLAREAQLLSDAAGFVERMTQEALSRCAVWEEADRQVCLDTAAFLREDAFLQEQMLYDCLRRIGGGRDLTAAHVEAVGRLTKPDCQSGRRVRLPSCGILAKREFDRVRLCVLPKGALPKGALPKGSKTAAGPDGQDGREEVWLRIGSCRVPGLGQIETRLFPRPADGASFLENIPQKKYTKWFDYDKIIGRATFRKRKKGDFLTIDSAGHKKSLKRYLIEEKIPAERRDDLVFLADGAHVMWVPGHRISQAYKVTEQTAAVLEVSLKISGKEEEAL